MGRKASVEHKHNIPEEIKQKYKIYYNKWWMPCILQACTECGTVRLVIVRKNGVKAKMCRLCFNRSPYRISRVKEALSGKPFSEEHRKRLRESWEYREVNEALKKNWEVGRQMSAETKQKMSKTRKGKPVSEASALARDEGNIRSWQNNRERRLKIAREAAKSEERNAKISAFHKKRWADKEYRANHSGDRSHQWLDGKSFEPYAKEFNEQLKELIRDRDNYICQKCGVPESELLRKLAIHHIDYAKKNCLPSNLISLCDSCNGKVNRNRDYWKEYFTDLLKRNSTQKKETRSGRKAYPESLPTSIQRD